MPQFYCFLSRYSGHRATSWNICVHIKSIFSAFVKMWLTDVRDSRCLPIVLIHNVAGFVLDAIFPLECFYKQDSDG